MTKKIERKKLVAIPQSVVLDRLKNNGFIQLGKLPSDQLSYKYRIADGSMLAFSVKFTDLSDIIDCTTDNAEVLSAIENLAEGWLVFSWRPAVGSANSR